MNKITAEKFCEMQFAGSPQFSPDGKYLAYTLKKVKADKKGYESDLYVLKENGKTIRLTAGGDGNGFVWTKENTLLFSAMREKADKDRAAKREVFSVFYEISPEGGEAVRAFELPIWAGALNMLDDGSFYTVARVDTHYPDKDAEDFDKQLKEYTAPAYRALEETPFWFNGRGFTDGIRNVLYLCDRQGQAKPVTGTDFDVFFTTTDGTRILFTGVPVTGKKLNRDSGLYLYDTASGETKTVLEPGAIRISYAYFRNEKEALLCASREDVYGKNQSGQLYVLDLETGDIRDFGDTPIIPAMGHVNTDVRMGGGYSCKMIGEDFYFIRLDGYKNVLCHADACGCVHEDRVFPHGVDAFDECGGKWAFNILSAEGMNEIFVDDVQITNTSDALKDHYVAVPEYVPFVNADGIEIDGWIMKPIDYVEGKKYPALYEIHGGPRTAFGDNFFHEMQYFASEGYFVFFCNPRGSDGKGDAFADIWGRYGSIDYEDLMAFCDHVLAITPDIDAQRLGVLGGSYGGYMTNWIIGHTDRFKAACSQRSIANWISFEFTTDIGATFTPAQHKTTTHEDVHALWDVSPLKYADKAVTPTLFIHSDHDFRCWMVEGIQMFTALKMHDVPTRLCLFADETHELSRSGRPDNRISRLTEMKDWFAKYLKEENENG
ncbi:MAG: S9 family peptidase [Clostridiales bacterium]|nr:S9 family peptidase [Clostridiales bacterium]